MKNEYYVINMSERPVKMINPDVWGPFHTQKLASEYIKKDILEYDEDIEPQLYYVVKKVAGYKAQPYRIVASVFESDEVAEKIL
jgi:hypothetical protein